MVAYNLVAQFRRQAAKLANIEPRRLSFKGVWTTFRSCLLLKEPRSFKEWHALHSRALLRAGKRKLPIERRRVNTFDKLTRDVQKPQSSKKHSEKKPTLTAQPLPLKNESQWHWANALRLMNNAKLEFGDEGLKRVVFTE